LDGIYPKGLQGYSEENQGWLRYDPEEAARLISEVPEAKDAVLELAVNSETEVRTQAIMDLIRQDLIAAGLDVTAVNYDRASRDYLLHSGKLMINSQSWSADFDDPENYIYTFFGSCEKTCRFSMNYCDESVIDRVRAARTIRDEAERLAEYAELEKILIQDEAVWVPLYSADHLFVMGERVERFTPYWAGWTALYLKDIVLKPEARQ
jgi:ABC-type transport system substrate-binding protein